MLHDVTVLAFVVHVVAGFIALASGVVAAFARKGGRVHRNGFARLLPGPYHVPPLFFFPQFLPLGLLIFWMIRVRFGRQQPG